MLLATLFLRKFYEGAIKMKKLISGVFLVLIVIMISSPTYAAVKGSIQIKIDGVPIASDVNPEKKNNRIMVPLRVIGENLGANIKWANSKVTLTKNDMIVNLTLNSHTAVKDGKEVMLDVKPYLKNDRIFVPIRFLAETFGAAVDFSNFTVIVDTKPLSINGVEVQALRSEYRMTMGGVVEQIEGNAYIETIHHIFMENKVEKVESPLDYTWSVHSVVPGGYYKIRQFDFLDQDGESIQSFDIYLVQPDNQTLKESPEFLMYDATDDQWYLFSKEARNSIFHIVNTATKNGFLTEISNSVP